MAEVDRCYWYFSDELGKIHIPGCMGAAINGPGGCTCVRDDTLRQRLHIAFQRIEKERRLSDWRADQLVAAGLPSFPKVGVLK